MPLLDLFFSMLWFFLFFAWIWLLIMVFADIFRSHISGWAKAGWTILVLFLPLLGVLIYLIVHGDDMQRRSAQQAADQAAAQQAYIRDAAGTDGGSTTADQLEKLANLHGSGALTDEEYAAQKAKVLNS